MFNQMPDTLEQDLSEEIIKKFHYELKAGVFEDRANGYAIGAYKERPNMVGIYHTTKPGEVAGEIRKLLEWYHGQEVSVETLAVFHARFESIHPFQDGNGRTGRMILFRESLKAEKVNPIIIMDAERQQYIAGLQEFRETEETAILAALFQRAAKEYYEQCKYFME